jgi:catechol 2,3-dioxygenase-like lactoylglutathione lyase family enzyme
VSEPADRLLDAYDQGRLSRRALLSLLSLLAARPAPASGGFTVRSLNHVSLAVSDLERSRRFYQDLFSLRVVSRQENGINLGLGPASFLGLYRIDGVAPGVHHLCLGIQGFRADAAKAALESRGLQPTLRNRDGVKELYFRDPDDVLVQVQNTDYRG